MMDLKLVYKLFILAKVICFASQTEEVFTCDDRSYFAREDECNYKWDCPDGTDEYNCTPDLVEETKSFQHPSSESGTWKLQVDEGLGIHINLNSNNSDGQFFFGQGSRPGISELHNDLSNIDIIALPISISLPISMVWIVYKTRDANSDGLIEINVESTIAFNVEVTGGTPKELSSPGYPEGKMHNWIGWWMLRFTEGMGGLIECDIIQLHGAQTIEIGVGEGLQLSRSIVKMTGWQHLQMAEIQVPYKTVWIRSNIRSLWSFYRDDTYSDDYITDSYRRYLDGSRFHCSVSAVNATLELLPNKAVDIDIVAEFWKLTWIGWNIQAPESFATVFLFEREDIEGADVGAGIDFEKSVIPEYFFSSRNYKTPHVVINGFAWTFLSSTLCRSVCNLSYTVIAVSPEDIKTCDGYVYSAEDICNNISTCIDGRDENRCVTARLGGNETITLYPPVGKPTDTIWSVIVERGYQPLLRLKNPDFSTRSQLEIGDGLFLAGEHPVASFGWAGEYFDTLMPSRSAWIRYKVEPQYFTRRRTFEMEITAKNIDDVLKCTDSIAVYDATQVCNGEPYCPHSEDEIGCEIYEGKVAALLTRGYPRRPRNPTIDIPQTWEYHTTGVRAMIVQFRVLDFGYHSEIFVGIGKTPEKYREGSAFYFTEDYQVKDLFLNSSMIWMRIDKYSRMWAEIRVVKPEDEIIRCNDDRHIATLDQLCDNLWNCGDGEDETGCDALSIGEGETVFIDIPTRTHRSLRLVHSWAFRTQQQNSAFAFYPIKCNSGSTQFKVGKGVNFMNTASVRYSKKYVLDRVIYIKGSEAWFLFSRIWGRGAVNVTTVHLSAKELYACEDSDQIISSEKLCDNAWDCSSGSDESDCEPIYIDENDNYQFSLDHRLYSIVLSYSWVFNISDGREASIDLTSLSMYRAQISIGLGSNPSNVNTRLVATIDERDKLQWKVSAKQFWVKSVAIDGFRNLHGSVKITSIPHQPSACTYEDFQCTLSRECIANNQTCDGRFDCEDRSDEISCDCASPLEVRCGTGDCIPRETICSEDSPISSDNCLDEKANC